MKIAIRGHESRGKEVIQILESLGGKNGYDQAGGNKNFVYFINNVGLIYSVTPQLCSNERKIYTLEEFEKEFPFKIGDEVMFPVKIGWESGKIIGLTYVADKLKYEVHTKRDGYSYVEPHKLQLYPMKEERNITLTLDKAKEWYKKGGELKEIALQAFSEKELNPLPRSWEEFAESIKFTFNGHLEYIDGIEYRSNSCFPNKSIGESSEICNKHVALFQLEQLRDCWRQGWKPTTYDTGYVIVHYPNDYIITNFNFIGFLSFPTKEMAEEFLECFRDLIEKAGDLI